MDRPEFQDLFDFDDSDAESELGEHNLDAAVQQFAASQEEMACQEEEEEADVVAGQHCR